MISQIKGILESIDKGKITVDVSGVGYEINISAQEAANLPKKGSELKLFTSQIVREDNISLYGFLSKEAKSLFSLLITVSGLGPKSAMNLLGAFPIDKLVVAITKEDIDLISTAQGIGRKTAQKIVIELKEKVSKAYGLESVELRSIPSGNPMFSDVMSALMTLGYSPKEAKDALIKSGLGGVTDKTIEDMIKETLKVLS